jgi:hypothetical protein
MRFAATGIRHRIPQGIAGLLTFFPFAVPGASVGDTGKGPQNGARRWVLRQGFQGRTALSLVIKRSMLQKKLIFKHFYLDFL